MTDLTPPPGYRLAHRFTLTRRSTLIWLNVIGTLLFVIALAAIFAVLVFYDSQGAPLVIGTLPDAFPAWGYVLLLAGTLILHEALHGAAILIFGKRPRFGAKLTRLVLYTTSDAYFPRGQYLTITLAPLVVIALLGIPGLLLLPRGLAIWAGLMVAMNTASAVGDLWTAAVIASFPTETLFHDEADGMSAFLPEDSAAPSPGHMH
ncbi:MAG: DUF3267 domain-containing protein [Anaerolineae bacterium]|nr:DUF3267 domain-containing protein [Anaerolineae bacterium]